MKALRYVGNKSLEIQDIPDPVIQPGHVIIAPEAVGICGTDFHILEGTYHSKPPVTLGHEVAGRVVELGAGVRNLKIGDLITVEPHKYCGVCLYCQIGYEHMCMNKQAYGVHRDGGMAEFQLIPAKIAYKVPIEISPSLGALTEPLACVVHSLDRMQTISGLPVLVIGSGPAGSLLIALLRLQGLHPIVAVDTKEERRHLALSMGADQVFASIDEVASDLQTLTDGYGFPFVVDAVGHPAILEDAMKLASRKGTILVFGVADPAAEWRVSPNQIYAKELTIVGSAINPFTHRRALSLLQRIPLKNFKIRTFSMQDYESAFKDHQSGKFDKIQFNPQLKERI